MLKILQARLQQYVNHELPDVQAGFRKGRGTRDQIANIHWIIKKAREFQRNIYFQTTCLLRSLYAVKSRQGTTDWFKIGKGVPQGCILLPSLFNPCAECIMRNARLDESKNEMKIAGRNIKNLRYIPF